LPVVAAGQVHHWNKSVGLANGLLVRCVQQHDQPGYFTQDYLGHIGRHGDLSLWSILTDQRFDVACHLEEGGTTPLQQPVNPSVLELTQKADQ
jgi:hypothetical protein